MSYSNTTIHTYTCDSCLEKVLGNLPSAWQVIRVVGTEKDLEWQRDPYDRYNIAQWYFCPKCRRDPEVMSLLGALLMYNGGRAR